MNSKPQPEVPLKGLELWAVEWEDAHWDSGEYDVQEVTHRPVNYVTTGIKLHDNETGFSFAADICETGSFRGINFIPAKMIVRKWKVGNLRPGNRRSGKKSSSPIAPSASILNTPSIEPS